MVRILLFLSVSLVLMSAQPDTLWTRTYGGWSTDLAYCLEQTNDGGFIIVGVTHSYGSGGDVWLIKTDSLGDTIWTRNYGSTSFDQGQCIVQTYDRGYAIAGYSAGDLLLLKTDSLGEVIWTKTYGRSAYIDIGNSIVQTLDGGYIVAGTTTNVNVTPGDIWLLKMNSTGDTLWTKIFGDDWGEIAKSVVATNDGGYVVAGGYGSFGPNACDVWLIKTDSVGNMVWSKIYGGVNYDIAYKVDQTTDGGYFITGYTESFGNGSADVWLIRTDSLGDTLWTKTWGGVQGEYGMDGFQTYDGGYAVLLSLPSNDGDMGIMRLDSTGNVLWIKSVGSTLSEGCYSFVQTYDRGYAAAGVKYDNAGYSDVWLVRLASETWIDEDLGLQRLVSVDFDLDVYPNPFRNHCVMKFQIPSTKSQTNPNSQNPNETLATRYSLLATPKVISSQKSVVSIKIFDVVGCLVKQFNHLTNCPFNQVVWDGTDNLGRNLHTGVYFIRLQAGDLIEVEKVIFLR